MDRGGSGYITRHSTSAQAQASGQHTRVNEGGGGLKKEKRVPKGRIAQCRGVEYGKVGNTLTSNCFLCLLSE